MKIEANIFDASVLKALHHIENVNFLDGQEFACETFKIVLKLEEYADEIDLDRVRRNVERLINCEDIEGVFDDAVRASGISLPKLMGILECKENFFELVSPLPHVNARTTHMVD